MRVAWRHTSLACYRLTSRPVEQRQIVFDGHVQKAIVAAAIATRTGKSVPASS